MRVKINSVWYDPKDTPIMVELDLEDKVNIEHMLPEATKYCAYPCGFSEEEIDIFMERN